MVRDSCTVSHARSTTVVKRQRLTCEYAFDHQNVCQKAFCFIHNIGEFALRSLRKHVSENGLIPREHAAKGRRTHNAYSFEVVSSAVDFIRNYSNVFGLPQPAASRGRANQAPTYHQNHKIVHIKYQNACRKDNKPYMQYRSFIDIWHQCIPHVVFKTPQCDVCKCYRTDIHRAVTEDEKKALLTDFSQHLEDTQKERDAYLAAIEKSKQEPTSSPNPEFTHLTFDFAQQVFLPYHARQVGPLFYKVPMRVQIFGICNDALPLQVNYLF